MASLFFPQLSTGALTQYPIKRVKSVHTTGYLAEDGTKVMYFDPNGSSLTWQLSYAGLNQGEVTALETLFEACCGQFHAFTFLDPLANLLGPQWQADATVQTSGTVYTNTGAAPAGVSQTLPIPAGYTYSFSVPGNLSADPTASITIVCAGPNSRQQITLPLKQTLLVYSGALVDTGTTFTVTVQLQPGQAIDLSQAQLEAQPAPSPFRPARGGIYPNAIWGMDELTFVATGPNSFSSKFSIVTHV
jgi:hypothetical protein